ncbi:MAG: hypothetical protein NT002_13300 [candidate division Zixibacteria bacterium]|nr:hypothetical protein [candidate division Zixibacteria bacterium]
MILSIRLCFFGKVHLSHSTGTDFLDDPVVPDYAAVCELNMRSGYVVSI